MSDRSRPFARPRSSNEDKLSLPPNLQRNRTIRQRFPQPNFTPSGVPLPPTPACRPRSRGARFSEAHGDARFGSRFDSRVRWGNFGVRMAASVQSLPLTKLTQQHSQHRNQFHSERNLSYSRQIDHARSHEFLLSPEYQGIQSMMCAFCKSNKESRHVYSSHWLKDSKGKVACPILRRYKCRHCGATGDEAHTDSYCPRNAQGKKSMKSVLTTTKTSAGKYRK